MNSEKNYSLISLTEIQKEHLKKFGALEYPSEKIALLLDIDDLQSFEIEFNNPRSEIYRIYHQGLYEAEYKVEFANLEDAQVGKTEAIKRYDKIRRANNIKRIIQEIDGKSD